MEPRSRNRKRSRTSSASASNPSFSTATSSSISSRGPLLQAHTSPRVTRSSTIQSPEGSNTQSEATTPVSTDPPTPNLRQSLRKRKSVQSDQPVLPNQPSNKKSRLSTQQSSLESTSSTRNKKRAAKSDSAGDRLNMDTNNNDNPVTPEPSSRRKAIRNKRRSGSGQSQSQSLKQQGSPDKKSDPLSPSTSTNPKENKKKAGDDDLDADVQMGNTTKNDKVSRSGEESDDLEDETMNEGDSKDGEEDGDRESKDDYDRDLDEDDMYDGDFGGHSRVSHAMRALSGMLNGIPSRLRDILVNLRNKEDISIQMIALQDLSEILLMANEDSLSGNISTDQFVKELVSLMNGPDMYDNENPELMLLACRCLANLMEALPSATANVVYGGAVPILCAKLLEIQYIDLAEQALSTLEKISVEYPTSIVREGGLIACLNFLDFFATNVQRTAVTTAANCCRNIPEDTFPTVRDVMPVLYNVLNSSDQKVVEQGCLCVARIVESFRHAPEKLEQLVSKDLLRTILQLLLPGTTNLVGAHIHTQFLRVLSIIARSSPALSTEMFKMNVTDTVYQILTGVSPPAETDDAALKIDRVMLMQALIHRPREQVLETLNVICELLPGLPEDDLFSLPGQSDLSLSTEQKKERSTANTKRIELQKQCKPQLKRFALVILPTLTDTYTSTVNLAVRQKVVNAQLKMIVSFDAEILKDALTNVEFASYLASILSQQDHPTLVAAALQASELLLKRLPDIYRYHFHREGVISEISGLAFKAKDDKKATEQAKLDKIEQDDDEQRSAPENETQSQASRDEDRPEAEHNDDDDDDPEQDDSDTSGSESSEVRRLVASVSLDIDQWIAQRALKFMEAHDNDETRALKADAEKVMLTIKGLVEELKTRKNQGTVFKRFAEYFKSNDSLNSISSFELSHSKVVDGLLEALNEGDPTLQDEARRLFLDIFMKEDPSGDSPFTVLVGKLQDLLSRSEHFEVNTVHHNPFDGNRSPASMLAKQVRLKLVADDNSEISKPYRNIMVSIHAIATFKALDDYLRPRISMSDMPRISRREQGGHLSNALAAFAAAAGLSPGLGSPGTPGTASRKGNENNDTPSKSPAERNSLPSTPRPKRASRQSSKTKKSNDQVEETPKIRSKPQNKREKSEMSTQGSQDERLECMDERQLSDQEDLDDMDAVLEGLDQEMADSPDAEPGAVNMEIAAGGKVTARKEDGTRIATPLGTPGSSSRSTSLPGAAAALAAASGFHSSTRPMSYAAALNTPQDWHIEFSIDDRVISNDTTIYGAVHQGRSHDSDHPRGVWSSVYTIKFRRAPGAPPLEDSIISSPDSSQILHDTGLSVEKNKTTASILQLLGILHALNSNLDDIFAGEMEGQKPNHPVALSQFVNTKLTAKLNRQLEEPLIVASSCLPAWSEELARLYPFLFPFETRHLFLQSTSFGYSRSMNRWQSGPTNDTRQDRRDDQRPFLGRLQRQKVRISRSRILESAVKVMELYGASPSILEVEYFEEVGTGLGPTLEFYSSVSRQFAKRKYKLWRENDTASDSEFAFGVQGLFPAPMDAEMAEAENGKKVLNLFKILGKFVARSMLDSRIIDISFNPTFFRTALGSSMVAPSLGAVKTVDKGLGTSLNLLRKFAIAAKNIMDRSDLSSEAKEEALAKITVEKASIDDLGLDFTLPGYPDIELTSNGKDIPITIENVGEYVDTVIDLTLGSGIQRQVDAFRTGFSQVFPFTALRAFTPDELVMLFGRVEEDWSLETLTDSIKADHGFNMDSKTVRNLLQAMSGYNAQERREFLQFVTGSPKLPIGGFKNLTPLFTVVCKPSEAGLTSDDYLPSVMTCVNYLKLPDYSSLEVLKRRLQTAVKEGQGAFHLS